MEASVDTPLMRQYLQLKREYPDYVLFFRLGDFYEMFFDDAVRVSRELDLTLTSRDKGKENPTPMCGVPHHAAQQYLSRLVARGYRVALCEQTEDPKLARGIVKREVVRLVTPGVVLDEEDLDPKRANYLVALVVAENRVGLARLDATTGEFAATELRPDELTAELARLSPREILHDGALDAAVAARAGASVIATTAPSESEARSALEAATGRRLPGPTSPGTSLGTLALRAAATALGYAARTHPVGQLPPVQLLPYDLGELLVLDEATRAHLELFGTMQSGERDGSLWKILDRTVTPMGGRCLRGWLLSPLTDVARIRRRQDAVGWLVAEAGLRSELRAALDGMGDLERLTARTTLHVATPRDLSRLGRALAKLPSLRALLRGARRDEPAAQLDFPELMAIAPLDSSKRDEPEDDLEEELAHQLSAALVDDPPLQWKEGGIVRAGVSPELDELRALTDGGKAQIARIEERERKRTGIGSLKVRYNRVFGYYVEITHANAAKVPADYVRKQTVANAERFVTPELTDLEEKILAAEDRRLAIELELFEGLKKAVAARAPALLHLAAEVARIDALAALAEVAHAYGYARPDVDESLILAIEDGRHPVVERLAAAGRFVPNDVTIDCDAEQLLVITGPNMAGKSTVMRQTALIVLLAQMGSFVPARRARVGVCDRIFTRVGASDNLARGESTFLVEMRETAHILMHATRRSLVVLDEIGRGTSTYDGLAIAWAVAEHLHDRIGARALFATHYHELCALAETRDRVRNVSTAVKLAHGDVIFLHKLVAGAASRSYGIEVARLAGLSPEVVARARAILRSLEEEAAAGGRSTTVPDSEALPLLALGQPEATRAPPHPRSEVEERVRLADVDGMSPREALAFLAELQALVGR